jgi:hypothetical protein
MNAKYMRHKDYKHGHIYRSTECLSWIGSLSIVPIDCTPMWDTYPLFKRQCNTDTTNNTNLVSLDSSYNIV